MEFMQSRTERIPVQLDNGAIIKVEVADTGREDVVFEIRHFKEVTDALEGIVEAIAGTLPKVGGDYIFIHRLLLEHFAQL